MPHTPDEVRLAYAQTGSVRAAGAKLGISGARVHQILKQHGVGNPPLTASERQLLAAIVGLSQPVLRGPTVAQIAAHLNVPVRSLRYRVSRLRRLNLIYQDPDDGYLPTDPTRAKLTPGGDA